MIRNSNDSANYRNLYGAMIRLWSKEKKPINMLWPIPTDYIGQITVEERYEQNAKILNNG